MKFTTHHIIIRGRLLNNTPSDSSLVSSAILSEPVIDGLNINGVDADLRKFKNDDLIEIQNSMKNFIIKKLNFNISDPVFSGKGNGFLRVNSYNSLSLSEESWKITMLDSDNYTVVGTVSGVMRNGNILVDAGVYNNDIINFTICNGIIPFSEGDFWVINVSK